MPFKTLEERMLKYKRDCDQRMREELLAEVSRVREVEMSHVRLEEAAKYRAKLQEFRNELDRMHKEKMKEIQMREKDTQDRCNQRDREIEGASYDHRQKVIQDLEMIRIKE
jgi:hypothetical protein